MMEYMLSLSEGHSRNDPQPVSPSAQLVFIRVIIYWQDGNMKTFIQTITNVHLLKQQRAFGHNLLLLTVMLIKRDTKLQNSD